MVIEDRLALDDRWQNLLPNKDLQPSDYEPPRLKSNVGLT